MVHWLGTNASECRIGEDIFSMGVHHGVDIRIRFQDRGVDIALCVAARCAVDW